MMKWWRTRNYRLPAVLLLAVWTLSGCAGLGLNDYEKYAEALSAHSQAEADRIGAQSDAIWATVTSAGGTENEKLLLAVIGSMQIERLRPVPLNIDKPITGFAVLNNLVDKGPILAGFGTVYGVSYQAIKRPGVEMHGDNGTYAPLELHQTGSDGASATVPYRYGSPDTITTEIFEPEALP